MQLYCKQLSEIDSFSQDITMKNKKSSAKKDKIKSTKQLWTPLSDEKQEVVKGGWIYAGGGDGSWN